MEDFEKSVVWQDIQQELLIWIEDIRDALEDIPHFEDPGNIRPMSNDMTVKLRGAAATIRRVMLLPENIKSLIEEKHDERE